jgi:hypothetical protein
MRSYWTYLADPALHLLAIAILFVYLGSSPRVTSDRVWAEAPLPRCNLCRLPFLPGSPCECRIGRVAEARRTE